MSSSSAPLALVSSTTTTFQPSGATIFSSSVLNELGTTTRPTTATTTQILQIATVTTTRSSLAGTPTSLAILGPISVTYCDQVQVSWSGGAGPYSVEAYAPSVDAYFIAQTNETSWTFYNNMVRPGNLMSISIKDHQDINATDTFVVDGTDGDCPATMTMTVGPAATSIFSNTPSSGSDLSGGIIAGIVFAVIAFLTVIGASVWLYRRKAASRPQPVLPYLHREGKSGDRSSIISGKSAATMKSTRSIRSALSLWSTFGSRQDLSNERSHSVEDGVRVEVDTVQVVEEPKTPITMPASGAALFTPRRTTREWTGYNGSGNRKSDEMTRPSTILSNSSITDESTQIEFPNRQMPKPDYAPFNNNYIVYGLGDAKIHPIATSGSSHTDPSEQDASQLSQRDLEALADIVAARINQRNDYSSSSSENHRATPNTTDLPPRYY